MSVKAIPDGYTTVTAYLTIKGAAEAITFYKNAFNATEIFRMDGPDKKIMHAEIQIGNAHIMLADEFPEMGCGNKSPETLKGTSISIMLYVEGVDAQYAQAIQAGGKEIHPLQDHFYGDRSGTVQDPFGHVWIISQHIKDPTMEEIEAGAAAYMKEEQAKK